MRDRPADDAVSLRERSLGDDVRLAVAKLISLHDGNVGALETIACGERAIPALQAVLLGRDFGGIYEPRRRAVDALAALHAYDILIDYLRSPREITDPVEQTAEDAIVNAIARAVARSSDLRAVPLLLEQARTRPLAGVVEALGRLRRSEALTYFIKALAEDFTRPAAEAAIRRLGPGIREVLLRIPVIADSDSDRSRTLIPVHCGQGYRLIPSRVFVDVAYGVS